jgi:hypothetical protein
MGALLLLEFLQFLHHDLSVTFSGQIAIKNPDVNGSRQNDLRSKRVHRFL